MQKEILRTGVLFAAIPLMIVNFGNRYTALANLIRKLHDAVIRYNISLQHAERLLIQSKRLCYRLRLIGITQSCTAMASMLVLTAMIAAYFTK